MWCTAIAFLLLPFFDDGRWGKPSGVMHCCHSHGKGSPGVYFHKLDTTISKHILTDAINQYVGETHNRRAIWIDEIKYYSYSQNKIDKKYTLSLNM